MLAQPGSVCCIVAPLALQSNHEPPQRVSPLATGPLKAGLVTSLGFGHVAGLVAVVHPEAFLATLDDAEREAYEAAARRRRVEGRLRIARVMLGEDGYTKPRGRRLGEKPAADVEAAVLLNAAARLGEDEVYACQ